MSSRFTVEQTTLEGVVHLKRNPIGDARGFVERLFCIKEIADWGGRAIKQINRTRTLNRGTLRGLHFQYPPHGECKYVTCLSGRVFDVAVDLRRGAATYGAWFGAELSGDTHNALVIPEGFAHGFLTLTDNVEMLYLHSAAYNADAEGGVNALDAMLGIDWPIPIAERSARDETLPLMRDFEGITK